MKNTSDSTIFDLQEVLDAEVRALSRNPSSIFYDESNLPDGHKLRNERDSIGLALSGGGIRSATFCLGVLQALASRGKLASFDYLSTVSGGGYIGSWLTAWISRTSMANVQSNLAKGANTESENVPASTEPAELVWLRRYSNYLTPRVGVLSMDTLTLLATWLRNVTLNLIILLSFFALLFTLPYGLLSGFDAIVPYGAVAGYAAAWGGLFFMFCIGYNLWHQSLPIDRRRNWLISTQGVILTVIVPGIISVMLAVVWWIYTVPKWEEAMPKLAYLAGLLLALQLLWVFAELVGKKPWRQVFWDTVVQTMAGGIALVAGLLIIAGAGLLLPLGRYGVTEYKIILLCFGVPVFLASLGITTTIYTGMVGRAYYERSREWWSRLNAWLITIAFGWAIWCALTFFSLPALEWIHARMEGWISLLGTGWLGSLAATMFLKRPESASIKKQERTELLLNLASTTFVVGLVFLAAAGTQRVLFAYTGKVFPSAIANTASESAKTAELFGLLQGKTHLIESMIVGNSTLWGSSIFFAALVLLLVVTVLFAWRVDINKFSLHNMYKNRLVRCYLGASNQKRRNEQPFVGLDDKDDIRLHDLAGSASVPQVPLHIINTTLNLTQGAHLAWQERKAASFTFTPLYCGYSLERTQGDTTSLKGGNNAAPGYRPTAKYAAADLEESGFTLGMALATSGAAVSPNMGRASKPMLAFVLTLFNIRLGRWSPNPAQPDWTSPSPRFGLLALLSELAGLSDERSRFVYLSDGGHFDNLGLYELVRRRCKVILAVDASADEEREMTDLADAIRKCRVDLGVDIHFAGLPDFRGDDQHLCKHGYVIGDIHYDAKNIGTLVLIKPSLNQARDEPADILNYAVQNPTFPHQTTFDQFFDESQFESFRRLGHLQGEQFLNHPQIDVLLPTRAADHSVKPEPPSIEDRSHITDFIGWMLDKKPDSRPSRDGSLVDLFLEMLVITLGFALLMFILDGTAFNESATFCWTRAGCAQVAQEQLGGAQIGPGWGDLRAWRVMLDNVFVLLYVTTFLLGYKVASGRDWRVWWAAAAPVVAGLSDYGENFMLLTHLNGDTTTTLTSVLATFTWVKFCAFFVSLLLLVVLIPAIKRVFVLRWKL